MKTPIKLLTTAMLWLVVTITVNAQPTDNVSAYYPFNGNANDVTGNGKNGSISAVTSTADRLTNANAAYSYNGTNSLIYLPTNVLTGNTAFAISFWFKFSGIALRPADYAEQLIDFRGQYNFNVYYAQYNHPTLPKAIVFNVANASMNTNCLSQSNSIQDNTWYHIVATYANNTMQLYLNGSLVDTKSQTPPSAVYGYNNTIGKDYNLNKDRLWFNGIIDEVLLYQRGLTSTEVSALYNRGLTASEIPELYNKPNIQHSYDAIGRRTSRNVIVLKSASSITVRDSLGHVKSISADSPAVSFQEALGEQKVIIYPNPTQGQLLVEIQGYEKETNTALYLFDLSGKLLISKKPANSTMPLDLSGYSVGTYVLKVVLGDKTSEWKIMKE